MKLKLDESLSSSLKKELSKLGHEVATAIEEEPQGVPDERIARAASGEGRILLTLDVDFGDIREYPPGTHAGIIVFRIANQSIGQVRSFVLEFFASTDVERLRGCLVIAEPGRTRIRWPGQE